MSSTIEYALRAVVWLADHDERPQTTAKIADGTKMPPSYLSKVLQGLSRNGLVKSQRGLHGGFSLAVDANTLTVLDVVNAIEPMQRILTCPLGLSTHGKKLCALHQSLDDIMADTEKAFAAQTIGALLDRPGKSKPLCNVTVKGKTTQAKK
ncbi:MAG: Rrf2 family transcriptional regulator [Algisphaera sp.]